MDLYVFIPVVVGILLFIVLFCVVGAWGGRCEKCRSWFNWKTVERSYDDHQPNLVFDTHGTRCTTCGYTTRGHTETRAVHR